MVYLILNSACSLPHKSSINKNCIIYLPYPQRISNTLCIDLRSLAINTSDRMAKGSSELSKYQLCQNTSYSTNGFPIPSHIQKIEEQLNYSHKRLFVISSAKHHEILINLKTFFFKLWGLLFHSLIEVFCLIIIC